MSELIQEIAAIGLLVLVLVIVFRQFGTEVADYVSSKRKNKMKFYLISFEHDTGVGRILWSLIDSIDESTIRTIEKHLGPSVDKITGSKGTRVFITSITEIRPFTLKPITQNDSKEETNE